MKPCGTLERPGDVGSRSEDRQRGVCLFVYPCMRSFLPRYDRQEAPYRKRAFEMLREDEVGRGLSRTRRGEGQAGPPTVLRGWRFSHATSVLALQAGRPETPTTPALPFLVLLWEARSTSYNHIGLNRRENPWLID